MVPKSRKVNIFRNLGSSSSPSSLLLPHFCNVSYKPDAAWKWHPKQAIIHVVLWLLGEKIKFRIEYLSLNIKNKIKVLFVVYILITPEILVCSSSLLPHYFLTEEESRHRKDACLTEMLWHALHCRLVSSGFLLTHRCFSPNQFPFVPSLVFVFSCHHFEKGFFPSLTCQEPNHILSFILPLLPQE